MRRSDFITLLGASMAIAWPRALRAQQKPMPVIGFLGSTSPGPYAPLVAAFRQGLSETDYVEGQNLAIEYRWAENHDNRLPALAADLVGRKADLIMASGGNISALWAKNATSTIPIVFASEGDPVGDGLVASFARPGGNVTGVTFIASDLVPKLLELLSELVPQAAEIALLVNLKGSNALRMMKDVLDAADAKGVRLNIMRAPTESEIDFAYASLVQTRLDALVIGAEYGRGEQLVALASRLAVPAIYDTREATASGA